MPFTVPGAGQLPGVQVLFTSLPRDIFYNESEAATYFSPPPAIDGTASGNGSNQPYNWLLWAGMVMGKETATDIWATSIIGQTTSSYTSGATTLITDVGTATELVRRKGASGTFKVTGPPTASGTVATYTATYSAVNLGNGHITVTDIGHDLISGTWIQPTDGSETMKTLLAEANGVKVVDQLNTTRINAYTNHLWTGGGMINVAYIVNYPADPSMKAYLKAAIRLQVPNSVFSDDWT